ncbi:MULTISPECIES: replication initiator protein RctB domain-containing protein [Vibrio]|uniref:replication initiator protein RctB domain-containing protein n=1 Tax=Vibrio TaxID=662 RepID=UPI002075CA07|nr:MULTISPECIES: replication initiator protein RctB domain-containing protein [Vibrio]USD35531.1 hypothetical protein J8Z27_23210 [Vibrio sp. SCSIO 43186]USD72655.1 hypothetical protein J4N41_23215 [Vibrio sp. SCSIO 43139]USD98868.1 hypothetical protein CTT30_22565 [Vibrio coralliilyticus]
MLAIERNSRKSFYFTKDRPAPISESVLATFSGKTAQRAFLEALDELHKKSPPHSVIEFADIEDKLNRPGDDNYIRRMFNKKPLCDYIQQIEFSSEANQAQKWAKCYSLNYEKLSGLPNDNVKDGTASKPSIVAQENRAAKELGYNKSITASMSIATAEVTRFVSFARSSTQTEDTLTDGKNGYVKIHTGNKRIVAVQDVVVILACVYLTYAYHKYRLPYYQQNKIKHPPNQTLLSLSAIRSVLKKPRNPDVYKMIRESLDVTRDTAYDFMGELKIDGGSTSKEKGIKRRRILECDAILNTLPSNKAEARTAFYDANIFILKWDDELFSSIIQSSALFALPKELITIDPVLVVLYLKLRGMDRLKVTKGWGAEINTALNQFLHNYLTLTTQEFFKVLRKYSRKKIDMDGLDIAVSDDTATLYLFGYELTLNSEVNEITIVARRDIVYQYANVDPEREAPTHWNELAAMLMEIIETDDEVNARQEQRVLEQKQYGNYTVVRDPAIEKSCVITCYTDDSTLSVLATMFQSFELKQAELLEMFKNIRSACEPVNIGKVSLKNLIHEMLNYYNNIDGVSIDNLVVYFSSRADLAKRVERMMRNGLTIDEDIMSDIVTYLDS